MSVFHLNANILQMSLTVKMSEGLNSIFLVAKAYQPNLSLYQPNSNYANQPPCPPSHPLRIINIGHHAFQPSCPYDLLTYALLSRLLSHFGLFR